MDGGWTLSELSAEVAGVLGDGYSGQVSGRVREVPDARTIRWYTTIGLVDRPAGVRGRTALYGRRHMLQLVAIKRLQAQGLTLAEIQARLFGATDAELESPGAHLSPGQLESPSAERESRGAQRESPGAERAAAGAERESPGAERESPGDQRESAGAERAAAGARPETPEPPARRAPAIAHGPAPAGAPARDRFWASAAAGGAAVPGNASHPPAQPAPVFGIELDGGVTLLLGGRQPDAAGLAEIADAARPLLETLRRLHLMSSAKGHP